MKKYYPFLALCPFIYFIIFGWMDCLPMRKFDEVRLAITAVEMSLNSNFIVTYFDGQPDLWNTKPPLLIWIQCFFIKLFGINEIAIRLPSAFAAFAICLLIYRFVINEFKEKWIAVCSVFILITSTGFVNQHGARSGDYDTLLTLFMTLNAIVFYKYTNTFNQKYILWFFISLVLACMTKGVVGLLFFPAYFIYLILVKKLHILLNLKLWIGFLVSIGLVLAYYILRENQMPGYLHAVYQNELGGRYLSTLEGHNHEWWFYIRLFFNEKFLPWYVFLIIGLSIIKMDKSYNEFIRFAFSIVISFVLILSISQTKITWYDMPIYPVLSIITAFGVFNIYKLIIENRLVYARAFIILLFVGSFIPMMIQSYKPSIKNDIDEYRLCYFIKSHSKEIGKNNIVHFVYDGYNPQNKFYEYYLKDKYPQLEITKNIEKGAIVYVSNWNLNMKLQKDNNLKYIKGLDHVFVYEVL